MTFKFNDFLSRIREEGLATSSTYRIDFYLPKVLRSIAGQDELQRLSLYCNVAYFPAFNLNTDTIKTYGPGRQYVYSRTDKEHLNFDFYVDREMRIKKFFDLWAVKIHSLSNFHLEYHDDYVTDIYITQLDKEWNAVYTVILRDAFPTKTVDMTLDAKSGGEPHILTVDFSYWYWTPNEESSLVESIQPLDYGSPNGINIQSIIQSNVMSILRQNEIFNNPDLAPIFRHL